MHAEPGQRRQPRVDVTELARLDAGPEHGFDPSLVAPTTPAELHGAIAGEHRVLVQEDPDVIGVPVDHVEQFVAVSGQLLRGRSARVGDTVRADHHLVHHPIVDAGEQLLLGVDVVVERALAEVVGDAQLHDPGGVVPVPGEDRRRGVDDDLATGMPLGAAAGIAASGIAGRGRPRHPGKLVVP